MTGWEIVALAGVGVTALVVLVAFLVIDSAADDLEDDDQ